jgi:hypothetical protein
LTIAHAVNVLEDPRVKAKLGTVFMITAPHHGSDSTTYSLLGGVREGSRAWEAGKSVVKQFVDDLTPFTVSASAGERRGFWHPSMNVLADFSLHLYNKPLFIDPVLAAMGLDEHFYTAYFEPNSLDWQPLVTPPKPPPTKGKTKKRPADDGVPTKWPSNGDWHVARTPNNVFTTDYFYTWVTALIPVAFPPTAKETPITVYDTPQPPPNAISWAFDVTDKGTMSVLVAFRRDDLHPAHVAHLEAMLGGPLPEDEYVWVPSAGPPLTLGEQPATDEPQSDQPPSGRPPSDEPPSGQPPSDEPPSDQPPSDEPPSDEPPSSQSATNQSPARDAVPATSPRPAPPGLGNARQFS